MARIRREVTAEEAGQFYKWLKTELDHDLLDEVTGGLAGVEKFLTGNPDIVAAANQMKQRAAEKTEDARLDSRVSTNTQVFAVIYDCSLAPELEGQVVRASMMDMARNGMRLEGSTAIPKGTILSLTVAHPDSALSFMHLTGEVRWVNSSGSASGSAHNVGLSIFNIEDYEQWLDYFKASTKDA